MLVDTIRWRVARTFHGASQVEALGSHRLFIEWLTTVQNGKHIRSLAGTSSAGRVLWRIRLRNRYPNVYGDRLIASVGGGVRAQELNVRTGRPVRQFRSWQHNFLITWSRSHGMTVSAELG